MTSTYFLRLSQELNHSVSNRDELLSILKSLDAFELLRVLNIAREFGRFIIINKDENSTKIILDAQKCALLTNTLYNDLDQTKMRQIIHQIL